VIVVVGAVYYGLVQRNRPAHMQVPEGDQNDPPETAAAMTPS
jgi:hypothetical protein